VTSRHFPLCFGAIAIVLAASPVVAGTLPRSWPAHPLELEKRFNEQDFKVVEVKSAGGGVTGAAKLRVEYPDGKVFKVKWKSVPAGNADGWNNSPRKEMATYELQRFVVDEDDYMIPTLAPHCLTMEEYKPISEHAEPNIRNTKCVLGLIAIWLEDVDAPWPFFDEKLAKTDEKYASFMSDLNVVTYLADHRDGRRGNLLKATDPSDPRVYAVDNGIAFEPFPWNFLVPNWNEIRVPWIRKATVERLRKITRAQLDDLGVVSEIGTDSRGVLHVVPHTANMDPTKGVRWGGTHMQFGLTVREIDNVWERLEELLEDIDDGKIAVR
jgi:hypothetical protein